MKLILTRKKTVLVPLFSALLYTHNSLASPWVEADDVLLRSNIQLLSDSGILTSATNTYPFRWVQISEQLLSVNLPSLNAEQKLAYRYVKHSYDTARLEGYRNQASSFISTESKLSSGFGDANRGEWDVSASKEVTNKKFSMRLAGGYQKDQLGENEYHFHDSYFALGDSDWQFSISNIERWWGHGWANSLSQSQNEKPLETIGLAYLSKDTIIPDNIWIESYIGYLDGTGQKRKLDDKYIWSSRISGKLSIVEYGLAYQLLNNSLQYQTTVDAKVSLPYTFGTYSSFYGSASFDNKTDVGRTLLGFDAQNMISEQLIRFYIEQVLNHEEDTQVNSFLHQQENTTIGAHLLLSNDHQLSIQSKKYAKATNMALEAIQEITYTIPVLSGVVTVGVNYNTEADKKTVTSWLSWDYRF